MDDTEFIAALVAQENGGAKKHSREWYLAKYTTEKDRRKFLKSRDKKKIKPRVDVAPRAIDIPDEGIFDFGEIERKDEAEPVYNVAPTENIEDSKHEEREEKGKHKDEDEDEDGLEERRRRVRYMLARAKPGENYREAMKMLKSAKIENASSRDLDFIEEALGLSAYSGFVEKGSRKMVSLAGEASIWGATKYGLALADGGAAVRETIDADTMLQEDVAQQLGLQLLGLNPLLRIAVSFVADVGLGIIRGRITPAVSQHLPRD